MTMTSLELCAGTGGQALGLEQAGFGHVGLVELEPAACATLRHNRPKWRIHQEDLRQFVADDYRGVDLVAGGVPCPPFSKAGKQLGERDERDLFPEALRVVEATRPKAVLLENVRGLLDPVFADYRQAVLSKLQAMGYYGEWRLVQASDHGVSQLRPRALLVAFRTSLWEYFSWPAPQGETPATVGELLADLMGARGWRQLNAWIAAANTIAPTLVGGSKKHGGPDLGPTRAKKAWAALGVDGMGLWDEAPPAAFVGMPRLTPLMTARLQGFPDSWQITGRKTAAYRQIGNAFPPPVACAVGTQIRQALEIQARKSVALHLKAS